MPQYLSPGVYVEEVDNGSKPIEGVGTAVAAFVGFTEKGPREATLITNWQQYRDTYGDFIKGAYLPTSVYGYFLNGGTRCYVQRISPVVTLPQQSGKTALEITPLLTAGTEEPVTVSVNESSKPGRYSLTIQRGDTKETFSNLSSDKADKAGRYVEYIINQHKEEQSKLVRVQDTSGNRAAAEVRSPKAGTYTFTPPVSDEVEALPAASSAVKLSSRTGDAPALELQPAPGVTNRQISVEVAEIEGQDELFKLMVKSEAATESFDVSFKKGPQYLESVINSSRTASKLIRVKDLSADSSASPAERRPAAGQSAVLHVAAEAKAEKAKMVATTSDFNGDVVDRTGLGGLEALDDVTMVAVPDLMNLYERGMMTLKQVQVVQQGLMDHCARMRNRVAILDAPPGMKPQEVKKWRKEDANYDSKYAALYYPWIEIDNPAEPGKTMIAPPSGHMAGIWSRSDAERGVHKAPANEIIRGAVGLELQITQGEQDGLNPEGINCIRSFPGRGIRVWGARTVSSDGSWRYLNVRRLFNYVEASIERGTQWIVFEPNDADLWAKIRRDVNAFLYQVWLSGALFGATPDQAYYVKCDEETNPPAMIDTGHVITEIGLAPVKPAEFVVFRISQMSNQSGG